MLTHYVKVVIGRKSTYLENAKYVHSKGIVFLSGYEVRKDCEPINMSRDTMHIISVGTETSGMPMFRPFDAIKIYACEVNKKYCELETKGRIQ